MPPSQETAAAQPAPAAPLKDFARVVRLLVRGLKAASYLVIGVSVLVMAREVAAAFEALHGVHPVLGWTFLVVLAAALFWFVGRPAVRYWRVPPALKQPRWPRNAERDLRLVRKRAAFCARYLRGLRRNPRMLAHEERLDRACTAAGELAARLEADVMDPGEAAAELERFENRELEPLLRPLDEEANRMIRREALAVGIGTAVSMNGAVDAFIVLWRNANLVARVAAIYYGRPGVRGSLVILRDVAAAMLVAQQIQGLMESFGGLVGGWLGRTGALVAGPAGDGAVNALATVRIGYVAKARCRAYQPWTEASLPELMRRTLKEVGVQGRGVVGDVIRTAVKSGLVKVPAEAARRAGGFLAGLFGGRPPEPTPPPAG